MPAQLSRHSLLPDLERSRAVLVAYGSGARWGPAESTSRLAEALRSPETGRAFHPWHTQVLLNPEDPTSVLHAVEHAARAATDVLLFHYDGRDEQFAHRLDAVAELLCGSQAVRPVVIIGAGDDSAAWSCFTRETLPWHDIRHPVGLTLLGPGGGPDSVGAPFTQLLVRALTAGIIDGPEVPELADICEAIDIDYLDSALGGATESYAPPQGSVTLHRGYKTPKVALSVNPSASPPYRNGAMPTDVNAIYDYWWG